VNAALDEHVAEVLGRTLASHPPESASLIPVLQDLNRDLGYLPEAVLRQVAVGLGVSAARVYHVATFYKALHLAPRGRHVLRVCLGTACHVRGAPRVLDEVCRTLGVAPGGTTADGEYTVETVNCLGACALGPVVMVDGGFHAAPPGSIETLMAMIAGKKGVPAARKPRRAEPPALATRPDREHVVVAVCGGTGCQAYNCQAVADGLASELGRLGLGDRVELRTTGCHGFCEQGPLVVIRPGNILYRKVSPADVPEIVARSVLRDEVVERLVYHSPAGDPLAHEADIPFYARQRRLVFGDNGRISPTDIGDYLRLCAGYQTLRKALALSPDAVVAEVMRSGLRGRGGGGFPSGRKWDACRRAEGTPKFLVCNADEGDPGAYMDRSLLEGNPHRVIEGMLIGAHAVGAVKGFVYVRDEYPMAVRNIQLAVRQAREQGYLGDHILGSGLAFDIAVVRGGGAFVCGEETALIASLQGLPGEARPKYVFPVEKGLDGKPTLINNVETWANVPLILERGSDWYASIGTATSKGTKIFSLVGKVVNTGLVEVPMGTTLRELIFDIGGGIPGGRAFKAVQTGGPSGGCLPASLLDTPIGFDELVQAGSMMGSGGLIVLDETSCMVDVARYFLAFLKGESCGKCVPCREGLVQMHAILARICAGQGQPQDMARLAGLAEAVSAGSLCALGGTAPNPVLSTLRYFRDEYLAHTNDLCCPAKVCKALIRHRILPTACTGCRACVRTCPVHVISGKRKQPHTIDSSGCIQCGACLQACRFGAVVVESGRRPASP